MAPTMDPRDGAEPQPRPREYTSKVKGSGVSVEILGLLRVEVSGFRIQGAEFRGQLSRFLWKTIYAVFDTGSRHVSIKIVHPAV